VVEYSGSLTDPEEADESETKTKSPISALGLKNTGS
jgi:hypothetical protein